MNVIFFLVGIDVIFGLASFAFQGLPRDYWIMECQQRDPPVKPVHDKVRHGYSPISFWFNVKMGN